MYFTMVSYFTIHCKHWQLVEHNHSKLHTDGLQTKIKKSTKKHKEQILMLLRKFDCPWPLALAWHPWGHNFCTILSTANLCTFDAQFNKCVLLPMFNVVFWGTGGTDDLFAHLKHINLCPQSPSVVTFISSVRSSYSDDGLLYIRHSGGNFFRFSLSPLIQLMLQLSL